MILVFTGNGKGKTTAALGQALRAIGQGRRVIVFQFIKSNAFRSGEDHAVKRLGRKLRIIKGGKGFVGILGDKLPKKVHKAAARLTLKKVQTALATKKFDLVVLDEVNVALALNLISKREVVRLVKSTPREIDLILTGRMAPRELIQVADLVTNFEEVKHPFHEGTKARRGIEY
ncbi:MAG: cob(I)yrinic acid a,c-diamide adenosyltransferase [Parcubacteria group bacterium]|nr:cob(I)yrinic acid a,c-diamide adenosyltransferase [Parcubacteria group bacterium]